MTDKWADYLISAVCFNAAATHIDRVRRHKDNGSEVGPADERLRPSVVGDIEAGVSYVTIFKKEGKWTKGAEVGLVTIDGTKYIRTDADRTKADNLDDLPTF